MPSLVDAIRAIRLENPRRIPVATVSGIASTNAAMMDWFATHTPVTLVTGKSVQLTPNEGNREPVIVEPEPGSFGNAVGLRNAGVDAVAREIENLTARRRRWPAGRFIAISLAANDEEGFEELAARLAPFADCLELNLSCPHAHGGYGSSIGSNPELVESAVAAAIRGVAASGVERPPIVLAKLTPNVERIGLIAGAAITAGAAGVAAINTVGPIPYREPTTGALLLTNPPDGRGGQSGRWIRARARACVAECRAAIGGRPLIVGMGGVESRSDAEAMVAAGADVVGIGSALARVDQSGWPTFLSAIAGIDFGEHPTTRRAPAPRPDARMALTPLGVRDRRDLGGGIVEIVTDSDYPCRAGQTVFLWIPGVGEKPFALASARPATVLVRARGPFSRALARLDRGDRFFVRGPYGAAIDPSPFAGRPVTIATGGSGTALVVPLLDELDAVAAEVRVLVGIRDRETDPPLETMIRPRVAVEYVYDDGKPGRVLDHLADLTAESGLLAIGPAPFMERALGIARRTAISDERCFVSLERTMLCGVGLCGACHCNGALTCQHGTFVSARAYREDGEWHYD